MQTDSGNLSTAPHRIEINLRDINQLFNTMDPSPFHEKDLDHDAEEFMVSWVREFPLEDPVVLVVHVAQPAAVATPQPLVEQAVQNYFAYRRKLNRMEFRQLMSDGRKALCIGLAFLITCLVGAEYLRGHGPEVVRTVIREGLFIAGWVAMWRPMEIYLYEWWPLRRRGKIFEKLSRIPVELKQGPASAA
jgi:hypothetical protein